MTFFDANKKVDKFQPCLKTVASLFPFGFLTFLIKLTLKILNETLLFIHYGIVDEEKSILLSLSYLFCSSLVIPQFQLKVLFNWQAFSAKFYIEVWHKVDYPQIRFAWDKHFNLLCVSDEEKNVNTRCQCYKTFFLHSWWRSLIS